MHICMMRSSKQMQLTVGKFFALSLTTFTDVSKKLIFFFHFVFPFISFIHICKYIYNSLNHHYFSIFIQSRTFSGCKDIDGVFIRTSNFYVKRTKKKKKILKRKHKKGNRIENFTCYIKKEKKNWKKTGYLYRINKIDWINDATFLYFKILTKEEKLFTVFNLNDNVIKMLSHLVYSFVISRSVRPCLQ